MNQMHMYKMKLKLANQEITELKDTIKVLEKSYMTIARVSCHCRPYLFRKGVVTNQIETVTLSKLANDAKSNLFFLMSFAIGNCNFLL